MATTVQTQEELNQELENPEDYILYTVFASQRPTKGDNNKFEFDSWTLLKESETQEEERVFREEPNGRGKSAKELVKEEELELIKSGLQAAFMMEEPVKSDVDADGVKPVIEEIREALKDPEKKLQESMEDDRSPTEKLRDRQE